MDKNPLTDPTSLIAYRLAHGETSRHVDRPARHASSGMRIAATAIVCLGVLVAGVFALALL